MHLVYKTSKKIEIKICIQKKRKYYRQGQSLLGPLSQVLVISFRRQTLFHFGYVSFEIFCYVFPWMYIYM